MSLGNMHRISQKMRAWLGLDLQLVLPPSPRKSNMEFHVICQIPTVHPLSSPRSPLSNSCRATRWLLGTTSIELTFSLFLLNRTDFIGHSHLYPMQLTHLVLATGAGTKHTHRRGLCSSTFPWCNLTLSLCFLFRAIQKHQVEVGLRLPDRVHFYMIDRS